MTQTQNQAPLAAAVIAATVALIGSILTNVVVILNEQRKHSEERRITRDQEIKAQAGQVFRRMFEVLHSIAWITGHSVIDPTLVTKDMIETYDAKVERSFPELLGAMALMASLDEKIYTRLLGPSEAEREDEKGPVTRVIDLEYQVAQSALRLKLNRRRDKVAIAELQDYNVYSDRLREELPLILAEIMDWPLGSRKD